MIPRPEDEREGFRRMREALRREMDPQDPELLADLAEMDAEEGLEAEEELDTGEEPPPPDSAVAESPVLADDQGAAAVAVDRPAEAPAGVAPRAAAGPAVLPPPAVAEPAHLPGGDPQTATVIAAGTSWSGTMRAEGSIYLYGAVVGALEARDAIVVSEEATVEGSLKAPSILIAGQCSGQVDCAGWLVITDSGRLSSTTAPVRAESTRVAGELTGYLECANRLEVTATGQVTGVVVAGVLVVEEGGLLDGTVNRGLPAPAGSGADAPSAAGRSTGLRAAFRRLFGRPEPAAPSRADQIAAERL